MVDHREVSVSRAAHKEVRHHATSENGHRRVMHHAATVLAMSEFLKQVRFYRCERCRHEWRAGERKPQQCRKCNSRRWHLPPAATVRPARYATPTRLHPAIARLLAQTGN
jgi:hypothetical protein